MWASFVGALLQQCPAVCGCRESHLIPNPNARVEEYAVGSVVNDSDLVRAALLLDGSCGRQDEVVPVLLQSLAKR